MNPSAVGAHRIFARASLRCVPGSQTPSSWEQLRASLRRKEMFFCALRSQGCTLSRALLRVNDGEQRARSRRVVYAIVEGTP